MEKPVLVVLAAGMGSRYGGLKQMDPVGPNGEAILDYSVYDAIQAGFEKVVFIIKKEIEKDFKEIVGSRVEKHIKVEYAFQDINNLPEGYSVPEGREKPWGTTHAVLSAKELINGPFCVINADDFYGRAAYKTIYDFLINNSGGSAKNHYCMVGYEVQNTVTENGTVARGVCVKDENGFLTDIKERLKIEKHNTGARFTEDDGKTWTDLPAGTLVSMNFWGLNNNFFEEAEKMFPAFLDENIKTNPLKCEFLLPNTIDDCIKANNADVKVLSSSDTWYGVTYKEDKPSVVKAIAEKHEKGEYPTPLWNNK